MKFRTIVIFVAAGVVATTAAVSLYTVYGGTSKSCCLASADENKGPVYVLYAGSLVNAMERSLGPAFQNATGYTYQGEGHGSLQDARMMINDVRSPDVFIGVGTDAMQLLVSQSPPRATWWLSFAADQLVIAYSSKSSFAGQLDAASKNQTLWYNILEKPGFKLGVSDPKLDPKGVFAVLLFKLASIYYNNNDTSLAQYLNSTHARTFAEETMPAELQAGAIDAIIAYKHEAIERRLPYVSLPSSINFGAPSHSQDYGQVSVNVSGKKIVGTPVTFAVTIPDAAKNKAGALAFVKFILNDARAQSLVEQHGLSPIKPPVAGGNNTSAVPQLFDDH